MRTRSLTNSWRRSNRWAFFCSASFLSRLSWAIFSSWSRVRSCLNLACSARFRFSASLASSAFRKSSSVSTFCFSSTFRSACLRREAAFAAEPWTTSATTSPSSSFRFSASSRRCRARRRPFSRTFRLNSSSFALSSSADAKSCRLLRASVFMSRLYCCFWRRRVSRTFASLASSSASLSTSSTSSWTGAGGGTSRMALRASAAANNFACFFFRRLASFFARRSSSCWARCFSSCTFWRYCWCRSDASKPCRCASASSSSSAKSSRGSSSKSSMASSLPESPSSSQGTMGMGSFAPGTSGEKPVKTPIVAKTAAGAASPTPGGDGRSRLGSRSWANAIFMVPVGLPLARLAGASVWSSARSRHRASAAVVEKRILAARPWQPNNRRTGFLKRCAR